MADERCAFGRLGEDLACEELQRLGYAILDRRFRTRSGEIDIIARDGEVLVFVEVKARAGRSFGAAFESITWKKRQRLIHMATAYLCLKRLSGRPCRFDVVAVTVASPGNFTIEVLRHAFTLGM